MRSLKLKHLAKVSGRVITPTDLVKWNKDLDYHNNKYVVITIKKYDKKRSNNINSYYWGVVVEMCALETGHTSQEIHEHFKRMFLYEKNLINNEWVEEIGSTTALTNKEMSLYVEACRMWAAAELSINVPDPIEK